MKLGVFTVLMSAFSLEDTLKKLKEKNVQMVELGCGRYPGTAHCDPDVLLNDESALNDFKAVIKKYDMEISALSCHTNPVHPNKSIAKENDEQIKKAILLAEKLGINQINTFSGCPGDCEDSKYPNWVTCSWPEDFPEILDYQWNKVLIPYWKNMAAFAKEHGVNKIALEPHPGFCVYNAGTVLKLREAVGSEIGANLDPSHLIWQGCDPVAVIKALGPAIFHFHAKDTKIDQYNTAVNGVLDSTSYDDILNRSWVFRTVGYGSDTGKWKDIISALKAVGYDHAISIEHEDGLMSIEEGLTKACDFLNEIIIKENAGEAWWI